MSKRSDFPYVEEILLAIDRIRQYTEGVDEQVFIGDPMIYDAVLMNLIIIGESALKISENLQDKIPNIPWWKIKGLRNRIAHDYRSVNSIVIWEIVQNEIPILRTELEKYRLEL